MQFVLPQSDIAKELTGLSSGRLLQVKQSVTTHSCVCLNRDVSYTANMDVHECLQENMVLLSFMYNVTMITSIIHESDCRLYSPLIILSSCCSQFANVLFCPTSSQKPLNLQYTMTNNDEKQQILTFEKL